MMDDSSHEFTLYFLDSHAYIESEEEELYDFIKPEQLDWVIKSAKSFKPKPNAVAFFHIPIWYDKLENFPCVLIYLFFLTGNTMTRKAVLMEN